MTFTLWFALLVFVMALVHAMSILPWRNAFDHLEPFKAPELAPGSDPLITVVVPARDASNTLGATLQDLYAQELPRDRFEVLVIDDHSSDDTAAIARSMAVRWPGLHVFGLEQDEGKKAAIALGVGRARASLILVSDADVRSGPHRLQAVLNFQRERGVDMVLIPVRTIGHGLLGAVQEEEQFALLGALAGGATSGHPLLANGANMAFKRDVFLEVGGYSGERASSGDDMFLLQRMRASEKRIGALLQAEASVSTPAETGMRGFISQRSRWAGKMRSLGGGAMAAGAYALIMPVMLYTATWLALSVPPGKGFLRTWAFVLATWCLWMGPVLQLIGGAKRLFGIARSPFRSILALLFFPFYAWPIALLSLVVRPVWKGRRVRV